MCVFAVFKVKLYSMINGLSQMENHTVDGAVPLLPN